MFQLPMKNLAQQPHSVSAWSMNFFLAREVQGSRKPAMFQLPMKNLAQQLLSATWFTSFTLPAWEEKAFHAGTLPCNNMCHARCP